VHTPKVVSPQKTENYKARNQLHITNIKLLPSAWLLVRGRPFTVSSNLFHVSTLNNGCSLPLPK